MRKKIAIYILLILLVINLLGGYFLYKEIVKKNDFIDETTEQPLIVEPKVNKLSMITAGDALIHRPVYNDAYNSKTGKYDFTKQITMIKPIVQKYDLAFYNQETILGGTALGLSTYPLFNSPYEVGDAMIDAGFNLVNLATNHTIDKGTTGVKNSTAYWKKQANILTAGSNISDRDRNQIIVGEKNGITYALLSYTTSTNGLNIPNGNDYLVNVYSNTKAKKDIESIRDKVDVVMVSMHWGVEYTFTPTTTQKEQARYLSSLGVDIIIGTHPHVIEPVTWVNDTLVIYSLGNFISGQRQDYNYNKMVGLLTSFDITKTINGNDVTIKIDNIKNELIYNYYTNWSNFKVIPFSQMESKYLANYKTIYNTYKKIVQKYDSKMYVVPCKGC